VAYFQTLKSLDLFRDSRCGFHLILALPLSKGFFWTGMALLDYTEQLLENSTTVSFMTQSRRRSQAQVVRKDDTKCLLNCVYSTGLTAFILIAAVLSCLSILYMLPLMVTLYVTVTLLFAVIPVTFYGVLMCCVGCYAAPQARDRFVGAVVFAAVPLAILLITLCSVHLSRIYYVHYKSASHFDHEYWELFYQTWGHFTPVSAQRFTGRPSRLRRLPGCL
jgi:hypothetical protein